MTEGVDWVELDRRRKQGLADYEAVEVLKEGEDADKAASYTRTARSLPHTLDGYLSRSTITQRQYDAGFRLYEDYRLAQGGHSMSNFDGTPPPQSYESRSINDVQLDASKRYTEALRQVGRQAGKVLVDIVIDENTAEQTAERLGYTRIQIVGALKLALDMLSDVYKLPND